MDFYIETGKGSADSCTAHQDSQATLGCSRPIRHRIRHRIYRDLPAALQCRRGRSGSEVELSH